MKRILTAAFVLLCAVTLAGCSNKEAKANIKTAQSVQSAVYTLQDNVLKNKQVSSTELCTSEIAPDVAVQFNTLPASEPQAPINLRMQNGTAARFNKYVNKLQKLYEKNEEVVALNNEINSLRLILNSCIASTQVFINNLNNNKITLTEAEQKAVDNYVYMLKQASSSVGSSNQLYKTSKQNFIKANIGNTDDALVRSNLFIRQLEKFSGDLKLAIEGFDGILTIASGAKEAKPNKAETKTFSGNIRPIGI